MLKVNTRPPSNFWVHFTLYVGGLIIYEESIGCKRYFCYKKPGGVEYIFFSLKKKDFFALFFKNLLTNAIWFDIIVEHLRKVSSVGRASALQAEGHRFEPCTFHQSKFLLKNTRNGLVAQLVRALACHARGRGFEPHPSRHFS